MIICNLYFTTLLLTQPQSPIALTESQPISFIILLLTQQGNDLSPLFQYEYVHQFFSLALNLYDHHEYIPSVSG